MSVRQRVQTLLRPLLGPPTITLNLTDRLIHQGMPGDTHFCPVALALVNMFPDAIEVRAGAEYATVIFRDRGVEWAYPASLSVWVNAYDDTDYDEIPTVEARSFELTLSKERIFDDEERARWMRWYPE